MKQKFNIFIKKDKQRYILCSINIDSDDIKKEMDIYIESFNKLFGRSLVLSRHNSGQRNLKLQLSKTKRQKLIYDMDNLFAKGNVNFKRKILYNFKGSEDLHAGVIDIYDTVNLKSFKGKIGVNALELNLDNTSGTINSWIKLYTGSKKELSSFLKSTYPLPRNRLICFEKLKLTFKLPFDIYFIVYDVI